MSLLMMRAAILAQGGDTAPPVDVGSAWELDTTRRPAGYTLSYNNQTAVNTSGGSNNQRWVPSAKPILPADGRRYWEVLCAASGAASFDGYLGVVSAEQREEYNASLNPITLGSIGWRGNGTLWSSNTATAAQRVSGLPTHGAGDVLMFVLEAGPGALWIGRNGVWRDDPVADSPTWTSQSSGAFYPQVQGRNPGDGGTLRSTPAQFSYPVPPGAQALSHQEPDLGTLQSEAWLDIGWSDTLSASDASHWLALGGGDNPSIATSELFIEVDFP